MKIIRPYKTFFVFLFVIFCFSCKKDWGSSEKQIYNPVDPPPLNLKFDPELFDFSYTINPTPVKIGQEALVTIKITRKNNQPIGGELYYYWKTNQSGYFHEPGFYYSLESLFSPRLDCLKETQGFDKNQVVFTTDPFEPLINRFSEARLLEIIDSFNPVTVNLKIGYKNENDEIRFFHGEKISITVQY